MEISGGKLTPTQTPVDIIETAVMKTPLSFFLQIQDPHCTPEEDQNGLVWLQGEPL